MNVVCPKCAAILDIPDHEAVNGARCPHCQNVFEPIEELDVEAADEDDEDADQIARRREAKARRRAAACAAIRKFARVMLAAFLVSVVAVPFNVFLVSFAINGTRMFARHQSFGLILIVGFYTFLLSLIGYAALQLFTAGSRGYILLGVVANFLLVLDFANRAIAFVLFTLDSDDEMREQRILLMVAVLLINTVAAAANGIAGAFAIRAVRGPELRAYRRM